jgi:hypothetical protein
MSSNKKRRSWRRWALWSALALVILIVIAAVVVSRRITQRIEPYIQEQTAAFLREHFDSDLAWSQFRVSMSLRYPLLVLLREGRGARVEVEVNGIVLRQRGRSTEDPPLITMQKLAFNVELSEVLTRPAHIRLVQIEGLELSIPPKGSRPRISRPKAENPPDTGEERQDGPAVIVDQILITRTDLKLLPRDARKPPLEFNLHRVRLDEAGPGLPMRYDATLTNAKPPGLINSTGSFGPWVAEEPSETPLAGEYDFRDADLGVFKGISGILSSTGKFEGQLNRIVVDGETDTPDFRLASSGNPLPLHTEFHAVVDGTNGDTALEPVEAVLNTTRFTAHGSVTRDPNDPARSMSFDVVMDGGRVEDMLFLAVKGSEPMLEGDMNLKMKLDLLPRKGELAERLRLDGNFELLAARFTSLNVQEKIDTLSRRGQGKPKQFEIANVPSDFVGTFHLEDGIFALKGLEFEIPGALVQLDGNYLFASEAIDFRGKLRLQARLSKTMSGWKRILLTPIDPFFAKEGYGTVLNIKVIGTSNDPQFGLDR